MTATNTPQLTRRQVWWLAIRPRTLPAAVGPVLVGTGLAVGDGAFKLGPALAALAAALLLQVASNLANDYYDFVKGYDQADRKGPTRVALSGLISLKELRLGLAVVLLVTAAIGLYLIYVGGWPVLALGVAAMISAVIYSGGPFPLSVHGLGDLFVFLFFGLAAVAGTYYVQALAVTPEALLAALPPGFLITAILVVNNLRDVETDARVGKRTLAVRLGPAGARREYTLLLVGSYLVPVVMLVLRVASTGGFASALRWGEASMLALGDHRGLAPTVLLLLLPWLTLPAALRLRRIIYTATDGPTLNRALAGTARLSLHFGILFAIGLALA